MSRDEEKVACQTPTPGKQPVRIPRWKYDAVRAAILEVVPRREPGMAFRELPAAVEKKMHPRMRSQLGSVGWHVTTVKLDMEVDGELRRVAGVRPQHLVLTSEPTRRRHAREPASGARARARRVPREVTAYFDAAPGDRAERLRELQDLILGLYPNATVDMSYRMPTYRVGEGWVALANQKRYVSLYTCSAAHIAAFRAKHPGIDAGTGCLRFKDRDSLPLADVKAVVRHAIEHPKG